MSMTRARLLQAIDQARTRAAELETERARELECIAALEAELAAVDSQSTIVQQPQPVAEGARRSPAAKLEIFRGLFRGRIDVDPTRFVSKKGKAGYAPACMNKFVPGKCELPKVKCGECKNQAFFPVDDAALLDHLRGHHVMGIYPLLLDGTCWFLVAGRSLGSTQAWLLRIDRDHGRAP